jgi:hypothetical protein
VDFPTLSYMVARAHGEISRAEMSAKRGWKIQNIPEDAANIFPDGFEGSGWESYFDTGTIADKGTLIIRVEEGILVNLPSLRANQKLPKIPSSKVNRNLMGGFPCGVQKEPRLFTGQEDSFEYRFFTKNTEHWAPRLPITRKL